MADPLRAVQSYIKAIAPCLLFYTQPSCPSSNLVKTLVQDAQVAALNLYKTLGGKSVIVDCSTAGVFAY
ncbi:hypothetical protein JCM10207_004007 [Rhodosporidiobolus poonsookiae]